MERFQEREKTRRRGKCCLNEGTEVPREQEGRLTKSRDTETRGSGGHLSPMVKLYLVVLEVPRSSPKNGQLPHIGCHKSDTKQGCWPFPINRNWLEFRQEIQTRLYWGPSCRRGKQEQTTGSLACSLAGRGSELVLYMG